MNAFRTRPHWVDEEPLIQSMLNQFIDQLDRGAKTQVRVTQKNTPELYDPQDDSDYLWELIQSLDNEYHLLTVKPQSQQHQFIFENANIYFNPDKEGMLREWLNRPALDPYTLVWSQRLDKIRDEFEDGGLALSDPIRVEGIGADEILNGFHQLAHEIKQSQTLRNLSAKCFWGDSKFLEQYEDLVRDLFPNASQNIETRRLMVDAFLPEYMTKVLFVENQDSYLMMQKLILEQPRYSDIALVYCQGFSLTNAKLRKKGNAVFSYLSGSDKSQRENFEQWWFKQSQSDFPCFFWGDLDYAAMQLLKTLRLSFENMSAWPIAYKLMLEAVTHRNCGHKMKYGSKAGQKDPEETGCDYADLELLPCIRVQRKFLDQEYVSLDSIT
jgi:hypothetical protein